MNEQDSKNSEVLKDFVKYCESHPYERFWQALRNWSEYNFIIGSMAPVYEINESTILEDTFYLEGKI